MEDFQKHISKNWCEISITKSLESSRISRTDLTNLSQINVDLVSGQSFEIDTERNTVNMDLYEQIPTQGFP